MTLVCVCGCHTPRREPCGNFAMYSSIPRRTERAAGGADAVADDVCEYRCGVHIDQTGCNNLDQCHPWALFEKQDFTSFIAEEDPLQGPTVPIPMTDITEERTAVMMANAIFQLCFSAGGSTAATPTPAVAVPSTPIPAPNSSASASIHVPHSVGSDSCIAPDTSTSNEDAQPSETPHHSTRDATDHREPVSLSAHATPKEVTSPLLQAPRHAPAELRAFMEHVVVQYCLNSDCDIHGRPRPATHPLLTRQSIAYFSDIVRCCCLSKRKDSACLRSLRGAQRGKRFFGSVARVLLDQCKEWLKNTPFTKGWISYFTSWGKSQNMPAKSLAAPAFSAASPRMVGGGHAAEDSAASLAEMPADLDDPEGDRTDVHNGAGGDGVGGCAGSQQFCFKADIMRIELHLFVWSSEQSPAAFTHDAASSIAGNPSATSQPKSLALKFCGPQDAPSQPAFSLVHTPQTLTSQPISCIQ